MDIYIPRGPLEIELDPNLPILLDKKCYIIFYENITSFLYEKIYRPIYKLVTNYPKLIIFSILLLIVSIISIITLTRKTYEYPCLKYSNGDLASSISQSCLNYLWIISCGNKATFDPTNTWWTNSPQGKTTIKCDMYHTGSLCGAGNYGAIVLAIQLCNPHYTG